MQFSKLKVKLERMDHKELYEFYKKYNHYIKSRNISNKNIIWNDNVKNILDNMPHEELNIFNRKFNNYIKNRLISKN